MARVLPWRRRLLEWLEWLHALRTRLAPLRSTCLPPRAPKDALHGQVRTDALKKGGGYHRDEVWNNALRVKKTFSEDRDLQEKRKGARAALPNR